MCVCVRVCLCACVWCGVAKCVFLRAHCTNTVVSIRFLKTYSPTHTVDHPHTQAVSSPTKDLVHERPSGAALVTLAVKLLLTVVVVEV